MNVVLYQAVVGAILGIGIVTALVVIFAPDEVQRRDRAARRIRPPATAELDHIGAAPAGPLPGTRPPSPGSSRRPGHRRDTRPVRAPSMRSGW